MILKENLLVGEDCSHASNTDVTEKLNCKCLPEFRFWHCALAFNCLYSCLALDITQCYSDWILNSYNTFRTISLGKVGSLCFLERGKVMVIKLDAQDLSLECLELVILLMILHPPRYLSAQILHHDNILAESVSYYSCMVRK